MNFVLRTHNRKGIGFRDEILGPWKFIIHRGNPDFENQYKIAFTGEVSDDIYALVVCERGTVPIFVTHDAYIMSESGQTFEKIYVNSNHIVAKMSPLSDYIDNPSETINTGTPIVKE